MYMCLTVFPFVIRDFFYKTLTRPQKLGSIPSWGIRHSACLHCLKFNVVVILLAGEMKKLGAKYLASSDEKKKEMEKRYGRECFQQIIEDSSTEEELRAKYLASSKEGKKEMEKRYGPHLRQNMENNCNEEWLEEFSKKCPCCSAHIQVWKGWGSEQNNETQGGYNCCIYCPISSYTLTYCLVKCFKSGSQSYKLQKKNKT